MNDSIRQVRLKKARREYADAMRRICNDEPGSLAQEVRLQSVALAAAQYLIGILDDTDGVLDEREACAKACLRVAEYYRMTFPYRAVAEECAHCIRARGAPADDARNTLSHSEAHTMKVMYSALPFSATVEGKMSAHVRAAPQVPFKGTTLCVSSACAEHFEIMDIVVGTISLLVNSPNDDKGGIPCTVFPSVPKDAEDPEKLERLLKLYESFRCNITFEIAQVSKHIALRVKNTTNVKREFKAVLYGIAQF